MPRAKILIVEDDSDVRRLYAIGLNQCGFQVKLASNGAEAIERAAQERPDVILLDWLMPLMDGSEVLEHLPVSSSPAIPVIVISGHPRPEAADARIAAWLTKPVTVAQLVEQIERCATSGA